MPNIDATTAQVLVGSGDSAFVAQADAFAQGANISSTLLYTVPANNGGRYRVSAYCEVTRQATTTATLAVANVVLTTADGGASQTVQCSANAGLAANPAVGANSGQATSGPSGTVVISAAGGTTINFTTTGYATSGATSMQYAMHIKLEYIGG